MVQPLLCMILVVLGGCIASAERRDIQDIRYHFTSCGNAGRLGPTYRACMDHYTTTSNSRLSQPGLLLRNTFGHQLKFSNAQLFAVPRYGLYNITVAGASGARGVCNIEQGKGISRLVQVELRSNLNLLVLVGQHGLGFCDVEPSSKLCENPPQNYSSAMACNDMLLAYLEEEFGRRNVRTLGGGGGGGASMIRAFTRQGFDSEPMVVGGGGGGTSALLKYDIVDMLRFNTTEMPSDMAYRYLINAKSSSSTNDMMFSRRKNSTIAAGRGGGYNVIKGRTELSIDGGYLKTTKKFAVGGKDCNPGHFSGAYGGFGGGGGACAGGGGGGGYLGGHVLGEGGEVPGVGGLSAIGRSSLTSFKLIRFVEDRLNSEPDGYVDIIDADCECLFKCIVYHEADQFECTCPRNTLLAPDGSDCYTNASLIIEEGPSHALPQGVSNEIFYYKQFRFESRIVLYSVNFTLVLDPMKDEEFVSHSERCIVAFLGEKNEVVAFTDVHRQSRQVNFLHLPGARREEHLSFLVNPVLVKSGLITSVGNCSVEKMTIKMNISIRYKSPEEFLIVDSTIPSEVAKEFLLYNNYTNAPVTLPTSAAGGTKRRIKIALGIFSAATISVMVLIGLVILGFFTAYICKHRYNLDQGIKSSSNSASTMKRTSCNLSNIYVPTPQLCPPDGTSSPPIQE